MKKEEGINYCQLLTVVTLLTGSSMWEEWQLEHISSREKLYFFSTYISTFLTQCEVGVCFMSASPTSCTQCALWQQYLVLRGKNIDRSNFGTSYFLQLKLLSGKISPLQSTFLFTPTDMNKEEGSEAY